MARVAVASLVALLVGVLAAVPAAGQETACVTDATGDVDADMPGVADERAPRADVVEACATYSETSLSFTVEMDEPTDPATDPNWGLSASNVWLDVDGDGEDEFQINYGAFDEGPRVSVIDRLGMVQTCIPLGTGFDGTRLAFVHVPPSCIGAPPQVALWRAGMSYGDAENGSPRFEDETAPAGPLVRADTPEPVLALAGDDTVDATIAWSQATVPAGGAPTVLLARDDEFADALASGPLQALLSAPLLLTGGEALDARVVAELERLGASTVFILGGTAAVSQAVEDDLRARVDTVDRIAGATRLETAAAIAGGFYAGSRRALVVRAFAGPDPTQAFADSLAAGSWGAAERFPVLLTETAQLSATTGDALDGYDRAVVVGGEAAVGGQVVADLEALGLDASRVAGAERAATAQAVADALGLHGPEVATRVVLVDGTRADSWAPGFAAALHTSGVGATPVVLSSGATLPAATEAWLSGHGAGDPPTLVCAPFVAAAACETAAALLASLGPGSR